MFTIVRTMLAGLFRDVHTLVWTILFPVALLLGLGLYRNDPAYSETLLAGVLATNVLFGSTMVTAFQVMAHRNRGIFKLLRVTPCSTSLFIGAVTGARTVLTLLISGILVLLGALVLGVGVGLVNLLFLLAILLAGTVCFTAIGFFAANMSRNESNVNMISNLISLPMLFTSEAFYSLQHAPKWVQILGKLQPFHYFVESLGAATKPAMLIGEVLPLLAVLIGFSAASLLMAVLTFRWDTDGSVLYKRGKPSVIRRSPV